MNNDATLQMLKRRGTALAFIVFAAVWGFAFAVHPDLTHPHFMLGAEDLVRGAHHNGLLQFAHALVTLNTALLVVITVHFMKLLDRTQAARAGVVGAALAVLDSAFRQTDQSQKLKGYAARPAPTQPAEQHEHHRRSTDLGITETSA